MSNLHLPDYTPVYPITKSVKPRQRKAKLPDWGTEQRATVGQNQTSPEWDVRWVLNPAQANTLDAFLAERAKQGEWFLWTPPGGTQGRFRCEGWTKTLTYCVIREFQASFRQVYSYNLPSLGASAGYFVLSLGDIKRAIPFRVVKGSLALVGNQAALVKTIPIFVTTGAFVLTGTGITVARSWRLGAAAGVFDVTPRPVALFGPADLVGFGLVMLVEDDLLSLGE
jgi:phage-related protein